MEFVQFHPTGMVWPPGVRGLLVTEAVRGEGGILRNANGERFMWKYLPEERRAEYAADRRRGVALGDRPVAGSRRPTTAARRSCRPATTSPGPSTPRSSEGRGSPHGGVFLDISYLPADHVRRKLPSMYEQFKELADVDITAGPMEVGPTTHYVMGGHPRRRGHRRPPRCRACSPPGEVAGGMHGANRLGGNSLSDLLVFGRAGPGGGRGARARPMAPIPHADPIQVMASRAASSTRRWSAPRARTRTRSSATCRTRCSDWSASSARRRTSTRRLESLGRAAARRATRTSTAAAAYNPGWNLVFELAQPAHRLRGDRPDARCCAPRAAARTAGSTSPTPTMRTWGT